jgi:hypothetical protein
MILANNPKGPEESPTEKAGRLGENLHHRTVQHFTVRKWWQTPLRSAVYAGVGMLFSAMTVAMIATFPWDDSTIEEKRGMLFIFLLWFFVCHDLFAILFFVLAVRTWADPHTLIFDGKGGLVLRSAVHDRFMAIKNIRTVVLLRQKNDEGSDKALGIWTKLSGSKLILPFFAEREGFLNALKAAHPAIVIETV